MKDLKRFDITSVSQRMRTICDPSRATTKEEKLPSQSAKPGDRDGFPRKSDFSHAVNHSFRSWEMSTLRVARATASSRDEVRSRSALRSRPVNSTIPDSAWRRDLRWCFGILPCVPMNSSSLSVLLLYQPSSPASSVDPGTSSFSSLLHARPTTARCVNRWPFSL